ncbi:MAG: SDR family NAD(P)-dependent oxidoreductase [Pseudomonadota bacterium]
MQRVLIAGAGGGIGLAMVDALATREDIEKIHAVHRRPVSNLHPEVNWHAADLTDPKCLEQLVRSVAAEGPLDALIVTSGLLHDGPMRPEKSLRDLDPAHLSRLYEANAIVPLMVLRAFHRHLSGGAVACLLSAQVGSIGDNHLGGWYGYRMAKAALNMAVKTAAIELGRGRNPPTLVAVHPGTTRTALSEPFTQRRKAPVVTAKAAAARLLTLLDSLTPEQHGAFLSYDGTPLPW